MQSICRSAGGSRNDGYISNVEFRVEFRGKELRRSFGISIISEPGDAVPEFSPIAVGNPGADGSLVEGLQRLGFR